MADPRQMGLVAIETLTRSACARKKRTASSASGLALSKQAA
jgi:hypothetical protein